MVRLWGTGVMEYWSNEKKYQTLSHHSNTPVLQPVPAMLSHGVTKTDTQRLFEIKALQPGLPYLGSREIRSVSLHKWQLLTD